MFRIKEIQKGVVYFYYISFLIRYGIKNDKGANKDDDKGDTAKKVTGVLA